MNMEWSKSRYDGRNDEDYSSVDDDRSKDRNKYIEKDRCFGREREKDRGYKDRRARENDYDREKHRSRDDRGKRKTHEEDYGLVNLGKHGKASKLDQDDKDSEASPHLSSKELEERILKMKEIMRKERGLKIEKERVMQLSKIFEEQDNIAIEGSDINDENVEIREQKCRDDACKAVKKKIYDDKFNDDPASEEGLTLDERPRFSGEAGKKLEEMLQFKKPKKKKSLRKKDKLDINALEAEAVSSGLGVGDLGSQSQAIKGELERCAAEMRSNAYRSAYAKADEASKFIRPEQSLYVKIGGDETPVFADDDDEDLRKSLEKARQLDLKKQEEKGEYGLQAIALIATSNPSNETMDDQNSGARESRESKLVFTEIEEFVRGLDIDEDAGEDDVFMYDDEEAIVPVEEKKDEAGGWTEVKEITQKDEQLYSKYKEEIVHDETIREVAVGKGLFGALKLCKDQGTLKESIDWGGRNMDKKKRKLVGIVEDEGKEAQNKKEIHIERTDEFGRILTPKEAYRILSQKFHGVEPGKMKQEKRTKQFHEELKLKQMKTSDTPLLFAERMREFQVRTKTPYVVLSGHVKPGHH